MLYMVPISECALHVYLTAILSAPAKSAIYTTFQHQSFGKLIRHPDRDDGWFVIRTSINLHNPIHSVVFSPNDDLIATAGTSGVQVWNTITAGNVASLGDDSSTSLLVRFSPSGAFLAAAFEGGTIMVWDPKVGREHLKHEGCHTEFITCIEFSNNSALLASGSRDHAIQVWSMETAQPLYRLATHEGPVTSLAFSSDSLRLFSGSEDNLIMIWDMSSGKLVRGMMGHRKPVNCIAVSQNGSMLVSGSEDKTIKLWDTTSGKCTQTFSKGHRTGIRSVHFFDEDKHVVIACDETILSWNIASHNTPDTLWAADEYLRKSLRSIPAWQTRVLGWAAPKPMLRFILHQTRDSESSPQRLMTAYATRSPSFVFAFKHYLFAGSLPIPVNGTPSSSTGEVSAIAISSDGNWAATVDSQGSLRILDLTTPTKTWEEVQTAVKLSPLTAANKVVPSPDGTRFIIESLMHWRLGDVNFRLVKKIDTGVMGSVNDYDVRFKFSADGRIFCCVVANLFDDEKNTLRVFDSVTGEQRAQFPGLKNVQSFVASADGAWTACGDGSGQVDVFRVASGERTNMGEPDSRPINILLFSDDAQQLVGGSKSGVVRVWNRASGECRATFEASTSMVTALAYVGGTPGGREARVAIGREDGSLCVWSPSTSASHDLVRGDQATVKQVDFVRFSDDGTRLTSRGEDGTAFSWAISFDEDDVDMARCTLCTRQKGEDTHDTSLPHLLSRSDPEDAIDSLFRTTYRVRKDGWLVKGDRRVIWIPPFVRPRGKDAFYAYENGQVLFFTPNMALIFLRWVDE